MRVRGKAAWSASFVIGLTLLSGMVSLAAGSSPTRAEHPGYGPRVINPATLPPQLPAALAARLNAPRTSTTSGLATTTATAAPNAFLTLPYLDSHYVTSVFDHCNPDYTQDGKVCRFDGAVGLKSNGVDPNFTLGYAQTPGGTDYLYYDGHNGWDLSLYYENVLASADGTVRIAGSDPPNPCFGQTIVIDHAGGFSTRYAHLSTLQVAAGVTVTRGQVIAVSGNTGCSSGPHLHFGVYLTSSWTAIDPYGWTGTGSDPWSADVGNLWLTGTPQNPVASIPLNVTAIGGNASAKVSWSAPAWDGGAGLTGYKIIVTPGGATSLVAPTALTSTVTGLSNGSPYTFQVVAVNAVGASGGSTPSNQVIPAAVPDPPANVSAASGYSSATVRWSVPANNGRPITAYTVTAAPGGATASALPSATNAAVVSGLQPGTAYTFTVTATNSVGISPPSGPSNSVVPVDLADASAGIASWDAGHLDLFARGPDNAVWHRAFNNGAWSAWESLGGQLASEPAAISWGSGRIDVFGRGPDNELKHRFYDSSYLGGWSGWESLGGTLASGPDVASWGSGRLDVVGRGPDGGLVHRFFDRSYVGGWSGWESLGGQLASDPGVVSWGSDRLDVFARAQDNTLLHRFYDRAYIGGWSAWENLGGTMSSSPHAASWAFGRLDVFGRGTDNTLIHRFYDRSYVGGWSTWESLGGQLAADAASVSRGSGRLDLASRAPDTSVLYRFYDRYNGGWSAWQNLGTIPS